MSSDGPAGGLARAAAMSPDGPAGEARMLDLALDPTAWDVVPGRSRLLLATAERDQLEHVLRLLPRALLDHSPRSIADVLIEGACALSTARVGWAVLPEALPETVVGGPDATRVDATMNPDGWPVVSAALGGVPGHIPDLLLHGERAPGGATGIDPRVATADGRPLRTLSAVPIRGEDEVRGVLLLAHHRAHAFSDRQLGLVAAFADHLGRVLDICESVREQTRIATALQETLLPPVLPVVAGVEFAARYRPGGSGNLVGGDFYDVFGDGAEGWYVLLGDASGIGPEAAGLAGVARYTARALADSASGPGEMLAHLNRALLRAAPDDRFCTAILAHLRPANGNLHVTLSSAGHPPPFLQRADGTVVPAIDPTGLVLGIVPDAPMGETVFTLEPSDALVCYTDGVIEAHAHDGTLFGEERLVQVLADAHRRSAAGTARRIERAVVDYRSPDNRDDLAIVVARCRP